MVIGLVAHWLGVWWLIGQHVTSHCRNMVAHWSDCRCTGSLHEIWWLIGQNVMAHCSNVVAHWSERRCTDMRFGG